MDILTLLQPALLHPVMGIYLRILALILLFGAWTHIASIFGRGETPWREMPLSWRLMDVVLLIFNLVAAFGLWQKTIWGIILFLAGIILLQFIPYTIFIGHFAKTNDDRKTLRQLLGTHTVLISILGAVFLAAI